MKNKIIEINGKKYKRVTVNETPLREQELDEGIIDDLLKKIVAKISSSDQKTVKQLSKKDPKFAKVYKQLPVRHWDTWKTEFRSHIFVTGSLKLSCP